MKTKRKVENEVGSTKELLRLKRKKVNLDQLYLDPDNPRFGSARGIPDKRLLEDSVQNNAQKKIETIGIADLLSSILRYGFVSTDPVVVRRLGDGKFVVVEGNRRVATLKKLFNSHKKGDVTLDKDILCSITDLVVLVYEGKDKDIAWIVQGLRHMSGIKNWPPLQQATFIAKIEGEISRRTSKGRGHPPGLPTVAKAAGVSTAAAHRLLNALNGFQQARRDEEYGEQIPDDKFSMFSEAVFKVDALQKWLGWDQDSRRFSNTDNLKRFLSWITPLEDGGDPKIIRALDARDVLPDILDNRDLLRRFEKGSLDIAEAQAEVERKAPREPDLDSLKRQLDGLRSVLETLPLPKIEKEGRRKEFKKSLDSLADVIKIQIKNLGK